jgi:hypothetical protein
VNIFKLTIAYLILVTLGFTLGAESFGKVAHAASCETNAIFAHAHEGPSASSIHSDAGLTQSGDEENCPDPCHASDCHFGHCSFVIAPTALSLVARAPQKLTLSYSASIVGGPALMGLRRPPRNS